MESKFSRLNDIVESRRAKVAILGAGYVGLPLACAFAQGGFETFACDTDHGKVVSLMRGEAYVEDEYVKGALPELVISGRILAEEDPSRAAKIGDFIIIAVPTPLDNSGNPDLSFIIGAAQKIAECDRSGKFVILESSVYPGTTGDVIKPILEKGGLVAGRDFGLAYSPERIDYGNTRYDFRDIPKIVGGITPTCTELASALYATIIRAPIVRTSSMQVAESAKMLENTYRYVNIALANELAILHERLGVDFFEVIAAASTKPFGFQPFYPGPGVGGHCIPKDPHYLSYKAHQLGMELRLVGISQNINEGMADHIVKRLEEHMRTKHKELTGARVAILGLAFKPDVSDSRKSPANGIIKSLGKYRTQIRVYDPGVRSIHTTEGVFTSTDTLDAAVNRADAVMLITQHRCFRSMDWFKLRRRVAADAVIVDTRGFWEPADCAEAGLDYLGLGRPSREVGKSRC